SSLETRTVCDDSNRKRARLHHLIIPTSSPFTRSARQTGFISSLPNLLTARPCANARRKAAWNYSPRSISASKQPPRSAPRTRQGSPIAISNRKTSCSGLTVTSKSSTSDRPNLPNRGRLAVLQKHRQWPESELRQG